MKTTSRKVRKEGSQLFDRGKEKGEVCCGKRKPSSWETFLIWGGFQRKKNGRRADLCLSEGIKGRLSDAEGL